MIGTTYMPSIHTAFKPHFLFNVWSAMTSIRRSNPIGSKPSSAASNPALAFFQPAHPHAPSVAAESNAGLCRAANPGTA